MVEHSHEHWTAGKHSRRRFWRWAVLSAVVYVVIAAFTLVTAVKPSVIGTWFTIYEEYEGNDLVYKVEVMIEKATARSVKVIAIDLDIKVTNYHSYGVHVIDSFFRVSDFHRQQTSLFVHFMDKTIPANSIQHIKVPDVRVVKVLGFGPRYLVQGYLEWSEIYDLTGEGAPMEKYFSELHSINEFMH